MSLFSIIFSIMTLPAVPLSRSSREFRYSDLQKAFDIQVKSVSWSLVYIHFDAFKKLLHNERLDNIVIDNILSVRSVRV